MVDILIYSIFIGGAFFVAMAFKPKKEEQTEIKKEPNIAHELTERVLQKANILIENVNLDQALNIDTNHYGKIDITKDGIHLIEKNLYEKIKQKNAARYNVKNGLVYLVYKNDHEYTTEIQIAIEILSVLWKKEKEKELSLQELSILWRDSQKINAEEIKAELKLNNSRLLEFFENHIKPNQYYEEYREIIDPILIELDTMGDCPSIVYGSQEYQEHEKKDEATLKLLESVTLRDHTLNVCMNMVQYFRQIDQTMQTPLLLMNMLITGLAHDLGKMPSLFNLIGKRYGHTKGSVFYLDTLPAIRIIPEETFTQIKQAIDEHHTERKSNEHILKTSLKLADQQARTKELSQLLKNDSIAIQKEQAKAEGSQPQVAVVSEGATDKSQPKQEQEMDLNSVPVENFNENIKSSYHMSKTSKMPTFDLPIPEEYSGQIDNVVLEHSNLQFLREKNILKAKEQELRSKLETETIDANSFLLNLYSVLNDIYIELIGHGKMIQYFLANSRYIILQSPSMALDKLTDVFLSGYNRNREAIANMLVSAPLKNLFYYLFIIEFEKQQNCSLIDPLARNFFYHANVKLTNEKVLKATNIVIRNIFKKDSLDYLNIKLKDNKAKFMNEIVSVDIPEIILFHPQQIS